MADSSWWDDIGDSLGSIFDSAPEEDSLKRSYNALQNPSIAPTGIPEFDSGITAALQSNQPIIDRSSKLMQQIYEPDHLTTSQLAGQALAAFLPALLGRAIGGNAGGVYGAKAGLAAQEGVIGAQKSQADTRRKSALSEYQAEKANFDANVKQAQGLQSAGVLLKRQDILAEQNLGRSVRLSDYNAANQQALQASRLANEHANRVNEWEDPRNPANRNKNSGSSPEEQRLLQSSILNSIEQRYGKDSPQYADAAANISGLKDPRVAEQLRLTSGLGKGGQELELQIFDRQQRIAKDWEAKAKPLKQRITGLELFDTAMKTGQVYNPGIVKRAILNFAGFEGNPSDKEAASAVASDLPTELKTQAAFFFGPGAVDESVMSQPQKEALVSLAKAFREKTVATIKREKLASDIMKESFTNLAGKERADRFFDSLGTPLLDAAGSVLGGRSKADRLRELSRK